MFEYLVAATAACGVFIIFMLVFMRSDKHGRRGTRLAGCSHHHQGDGCERCRDHQEDILPEPPERKQDAA